jgi:hypothetical protein
MPQSSTRNTVATTPEEAQLVDKQLGQDAQIWLFSRAKAVVFDDYSHFR